jgi:hypothetical protein
MDSTLHDIVHGVMIIAKVHAERMADTQPQHAKSLKKFSAALDRLRKEVVANVRSEMKRAKKE